MDDELLKQANDLIQSGDRLTARNLLGKHLQEHPDDESGWVLLYRCLNKHEQKRQCLEKILQINPENEKARLALERLESGKNQVEKPDTQQGDFANKIRLSNKTSQKSPRAGFLLAPLIGLLAVVLLVLTLEFLNVYDGVFLSLRPTTPATSPAVQNSMTSRTTSAASTDQQPETSPSPSQPATASATIIPSVVDTSDPPPTQVLAPTAVVITFTPEPTDTPTISPIPSTTLPPGAKSNVQILDIFYYGNPLKAESDEYIVIGNIGNAPQDVSFWKLEAVSKGRIFTFPKFTLQAGQICRIYTNEVHKETCGFSFQHTTALWNNRADCARIFNQRGSIVDEYCYNRD